MNEATAEPFKHEGRLDGRPSLDRVLDRAALASATSRALAARRSVARRGDKVRLPGAAVVRVGFR